VKRRFDRWQYAVGKIQRTVDTLEVVSTDVHGGRFAGVTWFLRPSFEG